MSLMSHYLSRQFSGRPIVRVRLWEKPLFLLFTLVVWLLVPVALLVYPALATGLAPAAELSLKDLEENFAFTTQTKDVCAWERDLGFFLSQERSVKKETAINCADRIKVGQTIGGMKPEYQSGDAVLEQEIDALVQGFPIAGMAGAIARYDREIAGLIVGIGKKESNWGKRTPKLNGEECFNFWGYRGLGTRGLTQDGYGCWDTPAAAVQAIGDRLEKLRDLRSSTEPARMVVWKCGNSCAGHSDESVRKWIADVDFYYRELAQK